MFKGDYSYMKWIAWNLELHDSTRYRSRYCFHERFFSTFARDLRSVTHVACWYRLCKSCCHFQPVQRDLRPLLIRCKCFNNCPGESYSYHFRCSTGWEMKCRLIHAVWQKTVQVNVGKQCCYVYEKKSLFHTICMCAQSYAWAVTKD